MKDINKKNWEYLVGLSRIVFIVGGLFLLVYLLISILPAVKASSPPVLAQEVLEGEALDLAKQYGLQGTPEAQKVVWMTLGEWFALNDAELGKDASQIGLTSDIPVFVFALRGNVTWHGFGLPDPNQTEPELYDNITVVLNVRTGEPVWVGSTNPGSPMPIPVP